MNLMALVVSGCCGAGRSQSADTGYALQATAKSAIQFAVADSVWAGTVAWLAAGEHHPFGALTSGAESGCSVTRV